MPSNEVTVSRLWGSKLARRFATFETERSIVAGQITEVTDGNFDVEVLESETAVLVDFWAPWCGPCRVVSPILEEIHGEREDLRVVKLNVDENQQTAVSTRCSRSPR